MLDRKTSHPLTTIVFVMLWMDATAWIPLSQQNHVVVSRLFYGDRQTKNLHNAVSSNDGSGNSAPEVELQDYVYTTVSLSKPMGLLMEEVEEGSASGVMIADMVGSSATTKLASYSEIVPDIAIGDALVKIGETDCFEWTFESTMSLLVNSPDPVELVFRRPATHVAVTFAATGVTVACPPGTLLKTVAQRSRATASSITYSCSKGDCATCEHFLETTSSARQTNNHNNRYVRPCVARVPKGSPNITLRNTDSFLFGIPPPF